jgi:uncharacterized protein YqgV (UPF0045/DUF77 family)
MEEVKKEYKYTIGDITYYQKPLVIGQINQLIEILKDTNIPSNLNPLNIIVALGSKVPAVIAVLLHEKDKKLKDKDVTNLATTIEFDLKPETTLEVVGDFFDCNQISLLLEQMTNTVDKAVKKVTGSKESQSSSQEETSSKEIK